MPVQASAPPRDMRSRQTVAIFALSLAALALMSCSRGKTLGPDELRSQIRSAESFAAESELFIDYIRQGRATQHYADGHALYLKDAVTQVENKLEQSAPEPSTKNVVAECKRYLELLSSELAGIATSAGDHDALAAARKRTDDIRISLEKAYSSL